jgi:hypothetical protein
VRSIRLPLISLTHDGYLSARLRPGPLRRSHRPSTRKPPLQVSPRLPTRIPTRDPVSLTTWSRPLLSARPTATRRSRPGGRYYHHVPPLRTGPREPVPDRTGPDGNLDHVPRFKPRPGCAPYPDVNFPGHGPTPSPPATRYGPPGFQSHRPAQAIADLLPRNANIARARKHPQMIMGLPVDYMVS